MFTLWVSWFGGCYGVAFYEKVLGCCLSFKSKLMVNLESLVVTFKRTSFEVID